MSNKMDLNKNELRVNLITPLILKYYKLIKISDDKFNGKHPNNINQNHVVYGTSSTPPTAGQSFVLNTVTGDSFGYFYTSVVTEIVDSNTFKTLNSTYNFEELPIPDNLKDENSERRKKLSDEEFLDLLNFLS